MIQLDWAGKMAFQATMPDGTGFRMDTNEESGGDSSGPSPVEALLASIAACSAMDVVAILKKKRQEPTRYRIEIDHERIPPGEYPRPITSVTIRHILEGDNLEPGAIERAIELSDTKYCSVMATLRHGPTVKSEFRIESPTAA
ncbi:MAG TPA: OsmC family protein [Fimbriimonadaceae bacterium]|nr:OsmC family protein [Fimbriimonadaceae bacterium]